MYFVDRTGLIYGRLTVLKLSSITTGGKLHWVCKCSCGKKVDVNSGSLQSGNTKSCGCLHKENARKQGLASTKHSEGAHSRRTLTYRIWQSMLRRCDTKSATGYENYGGRGLKVCLRWHSYINFKNDMGVCPPKFSIERINNNKGYYKSNCKWILKGKQMQNTRRSILIKHKGQTKCAKVWARELKIPAATFWRKVKKGLSIKQILAEKVSA